jgi:hypothetical protein
MSASRPQTAERDEREQAPEFWNPVERGERRRDPQSDQREEKAAHDLQRPQRVEETLVPTAFVADDARPDAHVRQHLESDLDGVCDGQNTEGLGGQPAGEEQVRAEPNDLDHAVARGSPEGTAHKNRRTLHSRHLLEPPGSAVAQEQLSCRSLRHRRLLAAGFSDCECTLRIHVAHSKLWRIVRRVRPSRMARRLL